MNFTHLARCAVVVCIFTFATAAMAQTGIGAPSRTIYKCKVNNQVAYTDQPCLGGQRIDTEPSRGLNKLTGKELIGKDVAQERHNEQMANVLRPLTGMNPQQFDVQRRRVYLPAAAKAECGTLDGNIGQDESIERGVAGAIKDAVQQDLYVKRKRYKELGC